MASARRSHALESKVCVSSIETPSTPWIRREDGRDCNVKPLANAASVKHAAALGDRKLG